MARKRSRGEDLAYAEWHRLRFPEQYRRLQHRFASADRDWTEFCHFCRQPLAIIEEMVLGPKDPADKCCTVTRKLAQMAGIRGYLLGISIPRPPQIIERIDELWSELLEIYRDYPPNGFIARELHPDPGPLRELTPEQWAEVIAILHRDHHSGCRLARISELPPVNITRLSRAKQKNRAWSLVGDQKKFSF